MGQVVCISDPEEAARRDEAYLTGKVPPLPPFPGLTDGVIYSGKDKSCDTAAGLLSVHGQVSNDGEQLRYDDAVQNGFHVIALDADPEQYLDAAARADLERIGGHVIGVTADSNKTVPGRVLLDVSGKYDRFFAEHGARAVLVRPDYYVFGAVSQLSELSVLVHDLASRLCFSELSTETIGDASSVA
jgi:hypothetical protein